MFSRLQTRHLMLAVVVFVLAPFLTWYGTWFGRPLTDQQITEQLDDQKPRKVQHAMLRIAELMQQSNPKARQWYPKIAALAAHRTPEIRVNAAWVMGQDNRAEEFREPLAALLADPDPLVRRNAALSLVRFRDLRGKAEIVAILRPFTLKAESPGTLRYRLKVDDSVGRGTLLAHIGESEVRSPLPGRFLDRLKPDAAPVTAGDDLLALSPAAEQVWEALRALYLVGDTGDLPEVERYAAPQPGMPAQVQKQAQLTARAIRARRSF